MHGMAAREVSSLASVFALVADCLTAIEVQRVQLADILQLSSLHMLHDLRNDTAGFKDVCTDSELVDALRHRAKIERQLDSTHPSAEHQTVRLKGRDQHVGRPWSTGCAGLSRRPHPRSA